jgi:hypothetical protein
MYLIEIERFELDLFVSASFKPNFTKLNFLTEQATGFPEKGIKHLACLEDGRED